MDVRPEEARRGRHAKRPKSRHRWRKWLIKACVPAVLGGVASGLVTLPSKTTDVPTPPNRVAGPRLRTVPRRQPGPRGRNGGHSEGQGIPATDPVVVLSEDPLDSSVEWTYLRRLNLEGQQARLTFEIDGNQTAWLNERFFALGGYAPLVHTRLVLANDGPASTTPAGGTLIDVTGLSYAPPPTSNTDISLGYELSQGSVDTQASSAPAANPASWTAGYFDAQSPPIGPHGSRAFDIWVLPSRAACNFWFHIVVLDGTAKFSLTIGDDGLPFRVSALALQEPTLNPSTSGVAPAGYGAVYLGGTASPLPNGALYEEPQRPLSRTAGTQDA